MPEPRVAVVWMTTIPDIQNTTRYQRAKTLTSEYDCDLFLLPGDIPDEISSQADVKTQSRTGFVGGFLFLFTTIYTIALMKNDEYDIVHTSYHPPSAFVGFLVSFAGVRWVHDIWDHPDLLITKNWRAEGLSTLIGNVIQTALYRTAYSSLGAANCIILALHSDFTEIIDIDENDVVSVPNGTDLTLYESIEQRNKDQFSLIYVGAVMTNSRGVRTLLQAVASVAEEIEDLTLFLVGDVHDKAQLKDSIRKHNLNDIIEVTGRVSHQQALQLIAEADVGFCLFPRLETVEYIYPIKIFEYMALGTVPVSSELTGAASIIKDGKNGFLVPPSNPKETADVIRETYYSDMSPIIRAAQRDVKEYDWPNINKKFVDAMEQTMQL